MASRSSIVEKMSTLLDETTYITLECIMHLHGHWNKMVLFIKPFRLVDFSNGVKFHNCTCWLTNDTQKTIVSCVKSITTTLTTKTWSSWVM